MIRLFVAIWFILTSVSVKAQSVKAQSVKAQSHLPDGNNLVFQQNKGQWPDPIRYSAQLQSGNVHVLDQALRLVYIHPDDLLRKEHHHQQPDPRLRQLEPSYRYHVVDVSFITSQGAPAWEAIEARGTRYNYFLSNQKKKWASNVKGYQKLVKQDLYPGIDLEVSSLDHLPKYEFHVSARSEPELIRLYYNGASSLKIENGALLIHTSVGTIKEAAPVAYQVKGDKKIDIPVAYRLEGDTVSFVFPEGYNREIPLVIDPLLIFSGYSGSTADNWGNTATYDEEGNLFSGGMVRAVSGGSYIATPGAYQTDFQSSSSSYWDVAIFKFDSAGSNLLWATYLGGDFTETPQSLVATSGGDLLVLGATSSPDFPVTNGSAFLGGTSVDPLGSVFYANGSDLFIAKLSANGSELLAGSFLGGSANDGINFISGSMNTTNKLESPLAKNYGDQLRGDVYVNENDEVFIASNTMSADFPLINTDAPGFGGGSHDAVIAKFSPDLSSLLWTRLIGGSRTDAAYSIKTDSNGGIWVAGGTNSMDFPISSANGGMDTTYHGGIDGWIMNISPQGDVVEHATYLGTSSYDQVYFIDINETGDIFAFGQTTGNYPVQGNVYENPDGGQFIHRLSPDIKSTVFSTVFGSGSLQPNISPTAFLVNECSNIFLAGWGGQVNATERFGLTRNYVGGTTFGLPITGDAFQTTTQGSDFYLMVLSEDGSEFIYGTFFGGSVSSTHVDGGTSRFDKRGIVYHAVCAGCGGNSDFPAINVPPEHQTNNSANCNNAAFKFDLATLKAALTTNTPDFTQPGITSGCDPLEIIFLNRSVGGREFIWDLGDGTITTQEDSIVHQYPGPGIYPVSLTVRDKNTCELEDVAYTTIEVFEGTFFVMDDARICGGTSIPLIASGGVDYQWSPSESLDNPNKASPTARPDTTTQYTVDIVDRNGCQFTDSLLIEVVPEITASFEFERSNFCKEDPLFEFNNTSVNGVEFEWDFGNGTTSSEAHPSIRYELPQNTPEIYTVSLRATNQNCFKDAQATITLSPFKIPNVVTPNFDDDKNKFIEILSDEPVNLKVLNRWGKVLFEEDRYQNDWSPSEFPAGVYYYEITLPSSGQVCKGWIQFIQ